MEGLEVRLARAVCRGDRQAAARLISLVERNSPEGDAALRLIRSAIGRAHVVGLSGPPGSGKSTLARALTQFWRRQGWKVGILAIDPSSPRSGGAFLGDRARLADLAGDPGVFVRSMASRGETGGLAAAAADAVDVLDALGCDVILVEAVGGGQADVDIAALAQTVVVVQVPGLGDDLQVLKAGLVEVADILVVNKADLPGAEEVETRLRSLPSPGEVGWQAPVVRTVATTGEGAGALAAALAEHRAASLASDTTSAPRLAAVRRSLLALVSRRFLGQLLKKVGEDELNRLARGVQRRQIGASQAADELLAHGQR